MAYIKDSHITHTVDVIEFKENTTLETMSMYMSRYDADMYHWRIFGMKGVAWLLLWKPTEETVTVPIDDEEVLCDKCDTRATQFRILEGDEDGTCMCEECA